MENGTQTNQPGADETNAQGAEGAGEQQKMDAAALAQELQKVRREAAAYRVKAKELEKIQAAELEKNGEYKKAYEEASAKLKEVEGLATEISAYRAEDERQLEVVKKTLSAESIALIDSLPPTTSTRDRLKWAQQLAGQKKQQIAPESRPGAGESPSVESVVEAYQKGDMRTRAKMLGDYANTNPQLYERLLKL